MEAIRGWLESGAGIAAAFGRLNPSVSMMLVMVDAVPMVMQVPAEREMPSSISFQSRAVMFPARNSSQYFHTSDPEPSVLPAQRPVSMGPAGTKMAGRFMLMAPISSAGPVLSQPPISTQPSAG